VGSCAPGMMSTGRAAAKSVAIMSRSLHARVQGAQHGWGAPAEGLAPTDKAAAKAP